MRGILAIALFASGGAGCADPEPAPAAGGATGGTCLAYERESFISESVTGAVSEVYDGPALVERSSEDGLTLYFEQPSDDAALEPVVGHVELFFYGQDPLPPFEPGAELWISRDHPVSPSPFGPAPPWAFSVRDGNGSLLFGSSYNSTSAAAPLAAMAVEPICTTRNGLCPQVEGAEVIYHSVEVHGDTPVTVSGKDAVSVSIDGADYQVWATGKEESAGSGCAADYYPPGGPAISLDVRAVNLASLVEGLTTGQLPACVHGNAPYVSAGFTLYSVSLGTAFEGPVFYERRDDTSNELLFAVPDVASLTGDPVLLGISAPADVLAEPAVGTEFWASVPHYSLGALRQAQGGPLLLASAYLGLPLDSARAAMLENLVGVPVVAEERCTYAIDADGAPVSLWDFVVQTDPSVRVQSGTEGTLELDGGEYAVFALGSSFTVYAR